MKFHIADTFTSSLARLNAQEQKAAKMTAFDLQLDPTRPGLHLHRVDRSRDPNFWAAKASLDLRIIVHRSDDNLLLCYVAHHDAAYRWAANRRIERHPRTGAAQLVEVREQQVEQATAWSDAVPAPTAPTSPTEVPPLPRPFAAMSDDDLLRYGVPDGWLDEVRAVSEDDLLDLVDHLPQEAAEALLELATGGTPPEPEAHPHADPFCHPDARRRFRSVAGVEELERALNYPWERWALFLHPTQRRIVEASYSGPARISGSAGTGKTVVALHRAVHLAREDPQARVLLTTFWRTLATALAVRLDRLVGNEPAVRERVSACSLGDLCGALYAEHFGEPTVASGALQQELLSQAAEECADEPPGLASLMDEWDGVVQALHLETWSAYRNAERLGQDTGIGPADRERVWPIFARVLSELAERGLVTHQQMFGRLTAGLDKGMPSPFTHLVVDEAQDLGIAELRFLAAIGRNRPDGLFFTGDLGQRIFRQPFSWKALGIDVRGRTRTLQINYRNSHEIRSRTDRLLPTVLTDADGFADIRSSARSTFGGPEPTILICSDPEDEVARVAAWLGRLGPAVVPDEIGVFVRSRGQLERARAALAAAGLPASELTETVAPKSGAASVGPMHLAKGLEFKAVVVMACDRDVVPLRARIEVVSGASDLDDVFTTERHLLYVACTRARDHLLIAGVAPGSDYLAPLRDGCEAAA